ncbi:hypothetical protein VNO78_04176 [Psophocarpus tetragonolobus]|uniref:Uncharacterized protein n=1 Tax=Psophocarpus tetragonolobus TaxID=3891 RepID=A0AAN9XWI4_PSOTE
MGGKSVADVAMETLANPLRKCQHINVITIEEGCVEKGGEMELDEEELFKQTLLSLCKEQQALANRLIVISVILEDGIRDLFKGEK